MYLHHLAYLGQEPPAIKNLIAEIKEPLGIAASDNTDTTILFPPLGDFKMNLSEPVKPKKEEKKLTEEEAEKLQEENAQLKEEIQKLKDELEERKTELSDSTKYKNAADIERLKSALNTAKIPTPQQERFLQIASALAPGKTVELSDGSGGTEKINSVDALIRIVSTIPQPVKEGVLNLNDHDEQNQTKRDYSRLRNKG